MALVRGFEKLTDHRSRVHPSETTCRWASFAVGGQRFLQLESSGSADRKIPGKVSQTYQFDLESAGELLRIIRSAFPELR